MSAERPIDFHRYKQDHEIVPIEAGITPSDGPLRDARFRSKRHLRIVTDRLITTDDVPRPNLTPMTAEEAQALTAAIPEDDILRLNDKDYNGYTPEQDNE